MDTNDFRKHAHNLVDWIADYYENIEKYPVKSQVRPGDILAQLPDSIPVEGESMEDIFSDFEKILLPGITHWQHPKFFAYFPSNSSFPSLLGEMLISALGVQTMKWETSPAAAELEEQVMIWLRDILGLPEDWDGVIQDTASTSTLSALIMAREKKSNFSINENGFDSERSFKVYCSEETHSSTEKGVKIMGLGKNNLRKIAVDENFNMDLSVLASTLEKDIANGHTPICVVATIGTTGSTAIDPLEGIARLCKKHNIWLHVDAAYAGSALILPECRWMSRGIELADSFVFNPHKWFFTNFDCSAFFVKDKETLLRTFEILPEYLKTKTDGLVNNYCDWGVTLGRRFRALKLWFVMRHFGLNTLREKIRGHLNMAHNFAKKLESHQNYKVLAPVPLNLVCFQFIPNGTTDQNEVNKLNEELMHNINNTGKMYLTHTKLKGDFVLRLVAGQTNLEEKHMLEAWEIIESESRHFLQ
jgi:aromatic-L-amino-acid decarboxylase